MNNISLTISRLLQRLARYSNPLTRLVLASRVHVLMSRRLMLLAYTGRKTGRSYTTPVSYVREGSDLLVPGGGLWWKNLASGPVSVRLQGAWQVVTPQVINELSAVSELLGRMMAANPAVSVLTGIRRGRNGKPDPQSLERARGRGFVVVRLRLAEHHGTVKVA